MGRVQAAAEAMDGRLQPEAAAGARVAAEGYGEPREVAHPRAAEEEAALCFWAAMARGWG